LESVSISSNHLLRSGSHAVRRRRSPRLNFKGIEQPLLPHARSGVLPLALRLNFKGIEQPLPWPLTMNWMPRVNVRVSISKGIEQPLLP
jgi:hypothetical protein